MDYAFDCTGVIAVIETIAETVGMLGTLVLIGGAPAGASFKLDHLSTLWGKRVIGVLGGGGRSGQLIPALVHLFEQGRFPFDRLVKYYEMDQIEQALADSKSGKVINPSCACEIPAVSKALGRAEVAGAGGGALTALRRFKRSARRRTANRCGRGQQRQK